MRGCFALFISAVISSICFNAHAQIAVFGISLGMSAEEILIEFKDNNYRAAYSDDDYGLPEDCVSANEVKNENCFFTNYSNSTQLHDFCGDEISKLRHCLIDKGVEPSFSEEEWQIDCPVQTEQIFQCVNRLSDTGLFEEITDENSIFVNLETSISPNADASNDFIAFGCKIFNGCNRSDEEIIRFIKMNLSDQLVKLDDGTLKERGGCMSGHNGDEICVGDGQIVLLRGDLVMPGMTLSLQ